MAARLRIPEVSQAGERSLYSVLTVAEAARLYAKHRNTILFAIDRGHLAARQTDKVWLVSVDSLVAFYGAPPGAE